MEKHGILYLCPTPIGNLEDITLRALKILNEVDYIAAEDTRVTLKLLNHFNIKTPLISYHEHNKKSQGPRLISLLQEGKNIALVTDAGTPGISDPGEDLVKDAIKAGINIVPLPGAIAAICALVASGLSTERFVFEGFLPKKNQDRDRRLFELATEQRTIIFYEAPHRIIKTLKVLKDTFGNRKAAVAREMTKIHEEFARGTLEDLIQRFEEAKPKGEMVIVLEGAKQHINNERGPATLFEDELSLDQLKSKLKAMFEKNISKGYAKNQALRKAAKELGLSRNEAYRILTDEHGKEEDRET
ncbi:16S rRNA (cytidine(1402)-2'-O)-methyltransferase [Tepidanaerobacter sp. GT38]|uniref:16S rRNA (cytidine(1402)-2'-O)-methyltransferase n=1 Tax=Tepidanaerobacter sp. GT38 TaxID=2722793 RepID=UPI001F02BF40|nr:16S rRNA (cytidine(1402)-2'-O)-methyltransferase [Tepidanaerobacter sp. GT38]MCG1011817.1 16S rRNA (cytidine(1402)-2'-O)-methyltransferase [Tepidanaerobacter sp. GT38]